MAKQYLRNTNYLGILWIGTADGGVAARNGTFSSRRIERATYRDLGVRFLTGDTHPDHDTICSFRRQLLPSLSMNFSAKRSLRSLSRGSQAFGSDEQATVQLGPQNPTGFSWAEYSYAFSA